MQKIKMIRENRGLSQSQLAAASGVPIRNIRAYEAESALAHKSINQAACLTVLKLAHALGCSLEDILEDWEDEVGTM